MNWVRDRLAGIPGVKVTVEEVNPLGGDGGFRSQAIQFSIRGTDLAEVTRAAEALRDEMAATGKFVDLDITYRGGKPEVAIEVDRNKAADLGIPVASVARTIRSLMAGDTISDLKEGSDIYDVILQMPDAQRANFEALSNLKVRAGNGQLVDLASVVRVGRGEGPSEIERQNRLRQVIVLAELRDGTLGEAQIIVEEMAKRIVPPHLTTSFMGDAEIMIDSFKAMLLALALAIVLVYMILAAQFDSLIQPITIMISLPLSVVGAFGGIYLAGMTLNIFSFIGLIMLMGLVTKTAILLVDFTNGEREKGAVITEALVKAGRIRLRPIVMTAAATIFGMIPVALALGEGGEVRAPMAVIVIGGMITSTVLTLVVVPVSYLLFDRLTTGRSMRWISRKFFGIDPTLPPSRSTTRSPPVPQDMSSRPATHVHQVQHAAPAHPTPRPPAAPTSSPSSSRTTSSPSKPSRPPPSRRPSSSPRTTPSSRSAGVPAMPSILFLAAHGRGPDAVCLRSAAAPAGHHARGPDAPDPPAADRAGDRALKRGLAPVPGGLTSEIVAAKTVAAAPTVAIKDAAIERAAAKVDQTIVQFLPQIGGKAGYTRLSKAAINFGGGSFVSALNGPPDGQQFAPVIVGPCRGDAGRTAVHARPGRIPAGVPEFKIEIPLNSFSLQANSRSRSPTTSSR
jgi:hypothetical protein